MARIKIEIDTDQAGLVGFETSTSPVSISLASKPMVLVSTITLTKELKQEFEAGAGQKPLYKDGIDYDDLPGIFRTYDGPNRLIITTGGLIAFNAAKANLNTAYFVSLVGSAPTGAQGRCLGGITVSGWGANSARVAFLVAMGRAVGAIGLFCNPKSAMNQDEEANWATIVATAGANPTIIHGGKNPATGKNDPGHYPAQIAQATAAGITTLIISADPYFFHTREKLISALNTWAAPGTGRYVCYPFGDYANSDGNNHPTAGTASWYGGSLLDAYNQIGITAALELNSTTSVRFTSIPDGSGNF